MSQEKASTTPSAPAVDVQRLVRPRPTAEDCYAAILRCQGDLGIRKMLRAWNPLELIVDYGGLSDFPPGPEACECWTLMEQRHGPNR